MRYHKHIAVATTATLIATGGYVAFQKSQQILQDNNATIPQVANVVKTTLTPRVGAPELYPDPARTPGATNPDITQDNISQNICNPNWSTKSIRPPVSYTNPLKVKLFNEGYHYSGDKSPSDAELDHFISLELGGNPTSEQNLWLESYNTSPLNAKNKDSVENQLHKEVCNGDLTLQQAQNIITIDWVACYNSIQAHQLCK